ncbi:inositol monophosphatase [Euzebya sp.]|uniref:inositol monophosphatase family protein n=1 Tax=Euzebya sp. TaxID=1971409 RepID=UPI00351351AB
MTGEGLLADLATATEIAAAAASEALAWFHRDVEWVEKSSATDLVSDADRAVEQLIVGRLHDAFAADDVVGEEGTDVDGTARDGARCWYVDPIDGTTNFLKRLPLWGISMGLADADDTLLAGVVVLPVTGEVFTAARGHGAWRNGVPIRCSDVDRLDRTLITYALAGDRGSWGPAIAQGALALAATALGTRMQGCSVADLTSVAMGRIDATIGGGMSKWDVAAGLLIAAEAGVRITTPDGAPSTGPDDAFVASPPAVHDAIRAVLADAGALPGG